MQTRQWTTKTSFFSKNLSLILGVSILSLYIFIFFVLSEFIGTPTQALFSQVGNVLGAGFQNNFLWTPDGDLRLWIMGGLSSQKGLGVILIILIGFGVSYCVHEVWRRPVQVICAAALLILIYGPLASIAFFSAHYVIYYCFHGRIKTSRFSSWLKIWITQLPVLAVLLVTVLNWNTKQDFTLPLGITLLCWQWMRLMIYYLDEKEGLVPSNLSFTNYLVIFSGPASVINLPDGFYIGQGYQYVMDRYSYQERSKTILAGVRLLGIALAYVLLAPLAYRITIALIGQSGVPVTGTVENLVKRHVNGENLTTPTILISCLLGQVNWFIYYAGAVHARVGIWRLFGYKIDPQFNKPWLSTNLVSLWERHTYHFRLALLRVSFFPIFFKLRKMNILSRISFATLGSAGVANMLWAHIPMYLLLYGLTFESLSLLPTWPYYLLLSGGILITEIYLLKRKKKRKPWSLDRWFLSDLVCAAATITYFSLIHVFARPVAGGSVMSYTTLFLKGIGISIQ